MTPWAILTEKHNGAVVVFNRYADRDEAARVVERLAAIGCPARIELARANDMPGVERRKAET